MSLYSHFARQVDAQLVTGGRLVLALSGGVDSRVLLDLLSRYQQAHPQVACLAVHVHHGLSDNADTWAKLCVKWGEQTGVDVAVERIQLDLGNGESIEKIARDARYDVLEKYVMANDVLLTGQHLDDQLETFLLAMKRGSGPKGLSSMAESMPFGGGRLCRPILSVERSEIEDYARQRGLEWLEDESNQDIRFDRNFLRHEITPLLKSRWPNLHTAVSRSARLCAQQERLLVELLEPKLSQLLDEQGGLHFEPLFAESKEQRSFLLRLWLQKQGATLPSESQLDVLWQQVALAQQDANPRLSLSDGQVRRFKNRLFYIAKSNDVSHWASTWSTSELQPLPDGLGTLAIQNIKVLDSNSRMTLSREKLPLSVEVVFNPQGLSAHPYGRIGSRKLKKLFQEYGVPSWLRQRTPILLAKEKVIAVAGLFVDSDFYGQDCELIWDK